MAAGISFGGRSASCTLLLLVFLTAAAYGQTTGCRPDEWQCLDGQCISETAHCDRKADCLDETDEQDCPVVSSGTSCRSDQWQCTVNGTCIPRSGRCNGRPECPDNSDEKNCPCVSGDFICNNGHCIKPHLRCDGFVQCADRSDEENCTSINTGVTQPPTRECSSEEFACANGDCIEKSKRCNGIADCGDLSDEKNCGDKVCLPNQFKCSDGTCIDKRAKCDGTPQCPDQSDEENCASGAGSSCRADEWSCADSDCISISQRCDNFYDCPDFSDEQNCLDCLPSETRCTSGECIPSSSWCNSHYDCRDNSDEANCVPPLSYPQRPRDCGYGYFSCNDGACILESERCNGRSDCSAGEDERNCAPPPPPSPPQRPRDCGYGYFSCNDGACILESERCNGRSDCSAGEDERNCAPPPPPSPPQRPRDCGYGYFRCNDERCIPESERCNGRPDCSAGEDESNCGDEACSPGEFRCENGPCIPGQFQCDGKFDCPSDISDELDCNDGTKKLLLRTYPDHQTIRQGHDVVFRCRDEGPIRAPVRWVRADYKRLPAGSSDINGRLEMPKVQLSDAGEYICQATDYLRFDPAKSQLRVTLIVEPAPRASAPVRPPSACGYDEATCYNDQCIKKSQVCDGRQDCVDGSDEIHCNPEGCEPNQFRCDNKKCVMKTWLCDSDDDCGDRSDERNCQPPPPGSMCGANEFECNSRDQCTPKSFHCDGETDCLDGSDETGCSSARILSPPPPIVKLWRGDTLEISCTAFGVPTPEVVWRLNWRHVPSKCNYTSDKGIGTLRCPNMQESDQGAYSCEALNMRTTVFAIPDSIVVVEREPGPNTCPKEEGLFNDDATDKSQCLSCFCFGQTTKCTSANLYKFQLAPPTDRYGVQGVFIDPTTKRVSIGSSRLSVNERPFSNNGYQVYSDNYDGSEEPYISLPSDYKGDQLESYGGYIKYGVKFRGSGRETSSPEIILIGNNYTLVHYGNTLVSGYDNEVAARFFEGDWYILRPGAREESQASREEIMMALARIDYLLLKARYQDEPSLDTTVTSIAVDSARSQPKGDTSAWFVEKCECPVGYDGNSCQRCAPSYDRHPGNWLGSCVRGPVSCRPGEYGNPAAGIPCKPCPCPGTSPSLQFGRTCSLNADGGATCVCPIGYSGLRCEVCSSGYSGRPYQGIPCTADPLPCDPEGSVDLRKNIRTGQCTCKDHTTGLRCDQCKANTFYLNAHNPHGCISCFCNGLTQECRSSSLYRDQISSQFNRDRQDYQLVTSKNDGPFSEGIRLDLAQRQLTYEDFGSLPSEVYYWKLPAKFRGNKITSYGGQLKYTIRFVPVSGGQISKNSGADVILISNNGIEISHHRGLLEANIPQHVSVPLYENHWRRLRDGEAVNREHLLMALANVKDILIKATYTTTTAQASILSVSLDTAVERNTGQDQALAVEHCNCTGLEGYSGTSCEECAPGYTRSDGGAYLGTCERCSCNGHSEMCDPETGYCTDCRDHTTGARCGECAPGYEGDATQGTSYDCVRSALTASCVCDPRGKRPGSECVNDECICKANVEGRSCDRCRKGTFFLSESNSQGCTECFCSGVTSDCTVLTQYSRSAIPMDIFGDEDVFTLVDIDRNIIYDSHFEKNPEKNEVGHSFNPPTPRRLFWSLPVKFTGNKVLSYGGNLEFKRRYLSDSTEFQEDIDVILDGNGIRLYKLSDTKSAPGVIESVVIPLKETSWKRLESKIPYDASRSDLMTVLLNLDAILIKASHTSDITGTFLSDIAMGSAEKLIQDQGLIPVEVESCFCPYGYTGHSCESCSQGFYRDRTNISASIFGECRPCPCNNNEERCDSDGESVVCRCKPGFSGEYCQISEWDGNCGGGLFRCENGPCIQWRFRCDGKNDCPFDNSDELDCNVPPRPPSVIIHISEPFIRIFAAGDTVTLKCNGFSQISQQQVPVSWRKEGGTLPADRIQTNSNGVLIIRGLRYSDSGTYVCSAPDENGVVEDRLELSVRGDPEPTPPAPITGGANTRPSARISPERRTVDAGTFVELLCDVSGNPYPSITWDKVYEPLNPEAEIIGNRLIFRKVSLGDRGTYSCSVRNPNGEYISYAVLQVERREPPSVSIHSANPTRVEVGDELNLECHAEGDPRPTISWRREDGRPIRASDSGDPRLLRVDSFTTEDAGEYVCVATNVAGTDQARVTVLAESPESQRLEVSLLQGTKREMVVSRGRPLRLGCRAEGNPEPQVRWVHYKNSNTVTVSQGYGTTEYSIHFASQDDEGEYRCIADNRILQRQEVVYVTVRDQRGDIPEEESEENITSLHRPKPTSAQETFVGNNVELKCQVETRNENPRAEVRWVRASAKQLSGNSRVYEGTLYIDDVQPQDAGEYICQVIANGRVEIGASTTLVVRDEPDLKVTPRYQEAILGQRASVTCHYTGAPPYTISWYKEDNELVKRSRDSEALLEFGHISFSDAGKYKCEARASNGYISYTTAEVKVGTRTMISALKREKIAAVGTSTELRCSSERGATIKWTRNDGALPRDSEVAGDTLLLHNLQPEDSGTYTCSVEAAGGLASDFIHLYVETCPEDGVLCPEGGSPKCISRAVWCDGFEDCKEGSDEAQCPPRSGRGAPFVRVKIEPNLPEVRSGDTVDVRCNLVGDNAPVTWVKLDGPMGNNVYTYRDLLRIANATSSNGGIYRCSAETRTGSVADDYVLTVLGHKMESVTIKTPEVRRAPLGNTVILQCDTNLEPPVRYSWSKRDGTISPDALGANEAVLTIPDIRAEDAGLYVCSAVSSETTMNIQTILVVTNIIPYFAQAPKSYLVLPMLIGAELDFIIEVSFKPEHPTGLILYNGQKTDRTGDFVSLGLNDGYVEFRFDVGSGPAEIRSDMPVTMGAWHTVKLMRTYKNGFMEVDGRGPFTGTAPGRFQRLDLDLPLYIGGVPSFTEIHLSSGFRKDFVGCISRVIVGNSAHNLMHAQHSEGVTSCESCAMNPCLNGGVCQEAASPTGYTCTCPLSYSGENCATAGDDCFPGACGTGKCVSSDGRGSTCLCPIGKIGERCEHSTVVTKPFFSGNSYIAYPPSRSHHRLKLHLRLNPSSVQDSLIMYAAQNDTGYGDYAAIVLRNDYLEFHTNGGVLQSRRRISPREWVSVSINYDGKESSIDVNGELVSARNSESRKSLILQTPILVGGYNSAQTKLPPALGVDTGFSGCISHVEVSGMNLKVIESAVDSANVRNCGSQYNEGNPCDSSPCRNGGECSAVDAQNYYCTCQDSYGGKDCEIALDMCERLKPCVRGTCVGNEHSYMCNCPLGSGGPTCSDDVTFTHDVRFNGKGWLEIKRDVLRSNKDNDVISLGLTTNVSDALVLWYGQPPDEDGIGKDYLSLQIVNGRVVWSYELGSGQTRIEIQVPVNDNKRHRVVLRRDGASGSIELDGEHTARGGHGENTQLNAVGNIFVGGVPDIQRMTGSNSLRNFKGCIHDLQIQSATKLNLYDNAVRSSNVLACDRTEPYYQNRQRWIPSSLVYTETAQDNTNGEATIISSTSFPHLGSSSRSESERSTSGTLFFGPSDRTDDNIASKDDSIPTFDPPFSDPIPYTPTQASKSSSRSRLQALLGSSLALPVILPVSLNRLLSGSTIWR